MRTGLRASLATSLALVLAAGAVAPALSRTPAPTVTVALSSVTCNPGGEAGLSATVSATASGPSIRQAQLFIGEYRELSDPDYAPFPWTGMTLANWISEDGWRTAVASDSRTLTTTDPQTWNRAYLAGDGLWSASRADAWWVVHSWIARSRGDAVTGQWYVKCPGGLVIDGATIHEVPYTEVTGQR